MGGLLGVGRASASPPRLIRLDYVPAKGGRRAPRVVIVGKGITFDTGGLSIKTAEGMTTMKRDMTGGGVVIAVLGALAALGCRLRVTGLVASAENAIGGDALRPGDVLTHFGGRTSEVNNTDAEGRLVLADALAYAVQELKPDVVIDVATLTGAMRVALGSSIGGLFANNDALADALVAAAGRGRRAGVADAARRRLRGATQLQGGRRRQRARRAGRDHGGPVPPALRGRRAVGPLRPRLGRTTRPTDAFEWTAGPTGYGARALLTWLASDEPLRGIR